MRLFLLGTFAVVSITLSGCGQSALAPTPAPPELPPTTPPIAQPTSTHSINDWLINYQNYGTKYAKTIDFAKYDEVITAALGIPNSDSVWSVVLYAAKGWEDGKPHQFYLQIGTPELGGLGGSYSYKHYGPYTDTVTALAQEAAQLKRGDKLAERIYLFSEVGVTTSSSP